MNETEPQRLNKITRSEYLHRLELVEEGLRETLEELGENINDCVRDLNNVFRMREKLAQADEDDLLVRFYERDGGVLFTTQVKSETGFRTKDG